MMKSVLKPGTVVRVSYTDFNNKPLEGYLCVLYDEELDASNKYMNNIIAIKITTSYMMIDNYSVPVTDNYTTLFTRDSMALCSKLHTFSKDQILDIKGRLHPKTFRDVYKCYRRFITELERQMESYF